MSTVEVPVEEPTAPVIEAAPAVQVVAAVPEPALEVLPVPEELPAPPTAEQLPEAAGEPVSEVGPLPEAPKDLASPSADPNEQQNKDAGEVVSAEPKPEEVEGVVPTSQQTYHSALAALASAAQQATPLTEGQAQGAPVTSATSPQQHPAYPYYSLYPPPPLYAFPPPGTAQMPWPYATPPATFPFFPGMPGMPPTAMPYPIPPHFAQLAAAAQHMHLTPGVAGPSSGRKSNRKSNRKRKSSTGGEDGAESEGDDKFSTDEAGNKKPKKERGPDDPESEGEQSDDGHQPTAEEQAQLDIAVAAAAAIQAIHGGREARTYPLSNQALRVQPVRKGVLTQGRPTTPRANGKGHETSQAPVKN
ncbi:hypothetical protein HDV00_002801 [Rhizophlyctis rosea]|nr:hypothetical protein HDV00_002801 [Rhizophlyctis rosea]